MNVCQPWLIPSAWISVEIVSRKIAAATVPR